MLVPIVVFKGSAHYHGWYSEVTKGAPGYFTYSPKGYSTSEIGLEWLRNFSAGTTPTPSASAHTTTSHSANMLEQDHPYVVFRPLNPPPAVGRRTPCSLQTAHGDDAVALHIKDTRTGFSKATFWVSTKRHGRSPRLRPTLKVPGALPALFHTVQMMF